MPDRVQFKDQYDRGWFGPFPFTEQDVRMYAEPRSGIYQIRDSHGHVVYIGIATRSQLKPGEKPAGWEVEGSSSVRARLLRHVRGEGNRVIARLRALNALTGYTFAYHLCDGESARQIESFFTVRDQPAYNAKTEWKHLPPSIMYH